MIRRLTVFSLAGVLAALSLIGLAAAEAEPDNAIKYRKAVMSVVGGNMSALVMIAKGEVEHAEALAAHAQMLAETSELSLAAFRQNTDGQGREKTTALGKVWSDWDDFEEGMQTFTEEANKLASMAEAGDMDGLRGQIGALGKACKDCHDDFRSK